METYKESIKQAKFQYDTAFHLLNVTYPLINDTKLLVGIINNIFKSMDSAMACLLNYERQLQLVPSYNSSFLGKLDIMQRFSARRNKISPTSLELLRSLHQICKMHQISPMEFRRGDKFIICNKEYDMTYLSAKDVRLWLEECKIFVEQIESQINVK